jgi:hypothetical protein
MEQNKVTICAGRSPDGRLWLEIEAMAVAAAECGGAVTIVAAGVHASSAIYVFGIAPN